MFAQRNLRNSDSHIFLKSQKYLKEKKTAHRMKEKQPQHLENFKQLNVKSLRFFLDSLISSNTNTYIDDVCLIFVRNSLK